MRWLLLISTVFAFVLCFTRHSPGAWSFWMLVGLIGVFASTLAFVQARLDGARDALHAMLEALQNLDQYGIPAGEKSVEASLAQYKSGKIDLLKKLLARRELALAKTRRLDLLESAWRAYADLAALSGDWP